jgi:uncharacterized protein (DUF1697 family)
MTSYVALLRAVNVGGTGKLPMTELRAMCEGCGFKDVRNLAHSSHCQTRREVLYQINLATALGSRGIPYHDNT